MRPRVGIGGRRLRLDGPGAQPLLPPHPDARSPISRRRRSSSSAPTTSRPGASRRSRGSGSARRSPDWRDAIERPDVDVVVVTAPNMLHVEIVEAACAAGKHVFCEKPVGGTPAQTARAAAAARRRGRDHGRRLQLPLRAARRSTRSSSIDEGRLGAIIDYRGRFFSMYGSDPLGAASAGGSSQDEAGYGVSSDLLSHAVDLAHMLVGPIAPGRRHARDRRSPSGRCRGRARERTTAAAAPDDPTGAVTNEDYVGAAGRVRERRRAARSSRRACSSARRARWRSSVYGTDGRGRLEPRADERAARLPRLRRAAHRATRPCSAASASRTTAPSRPGSALGIGFEDLIAIEDYEFLAGGGRGPAARARASRTRCATSSVQDGARSLVGVRRAGRTSRAWPRWPREDRPADDGAGDRPLPRRAAHRARRRARRRSFPGVFAIFGHGNVLGLGHALARGARRAADLPRAERAGDGARRGRLTRRRCAAGRSWSRRRSIGPGALNMVTAAGVAQANRLPVLLLAGDTFQSRMPDPGAAAGRALRLALDDGQRRLPARRRATGTGSRGPSRSSSRCRRPSRRCSTRPTAARPSSACPRTCRRRRTTSRSALFEPRVHELAPAAAGPPLSSRPPPRRCARARRPLLDRRRRRPLLARRGRARALRRGARHPGRRDRGRQVVARRRPPVLRRADRRHRLRPRQPARSRGRRRPRRRHAAAGLHDRLVDRVRRRDARSIALNAARFDATKHLALPLVGDARDGLRRARARRSAGWRRRRGVDGRGARGRGGRLRPLVAEHDVPRRRRRARRTRRWSAPSTGPPTPDDYALTAAGGFPGELNVNWLPQGVAHVRLRVRLLVHGLRDRRRLGRAHGTPRGRGDRLRRRRLVPDAQLRALQLGALRPQADRRRSATTAASRSSTGCRSARAARSFNNLLPRHRPVPTSRSTGSRTRPRSAAAPRRAETHRRARAGARARARRPTAPP